MSMVISTACLAIVLLLVTACDGFHVSAGGGLLRTPGPN